MRHRALVSTALVTSSLALALFAGGCPSETEPSGSTGPSTCALPFLGDPSKDPEIELIARGADGVSSPISDGGEVAMIFPPQGGRVIFAGVRATNIDPCAVKITGALRDLDNMQVRLDARVVNLDPTGDGWGRSDDNDISTFSNVPVCPNQWASKDIYNGEFELTVAVTDRRDRRVTKAVRVVPTCAESMRLEECLCICQAGYVLGQVCDNDGGVGGMGGAGGAGGAGGGG